MKINVTKLRSVVIALGAIICSLSLNAQDGQAIFKQNCASCHSVGKGRLVGPDLIGVHEKRTEEWLLAFIKNPAAFAETDADAKALIAEFGYPMPPQGLAEADVKAIITYIQSESPAAAHAEEATETHTDKHAEEAPVVASEGDATEGLHLFSGQSRFENGGPSCISCHNVKYDDLTSGGLLARDLTHVYDRMGDAGIKGILSSPPFPAMAASYKNNKLTEKEVMQLTAFFNDAHEANAGHEMVDADKNNGLILLGGGVAFLIILIIILIVFNKRKKDCVKQGIYDRQIKSDCSK